MTECKEIEFSRHAITRMFARQIQRENVIEIIKSGEEIENYHEDIPYPSKLLLGYVQDKPLHVVVAINSQEGICIIITTYIPDLDIWENDFKRRKNK